MGTIINLLVENRVPWLLTEALPGQIKEWLQSLPDSVRDLVIGHTLANLKHYLTMRQQSEPQDYEVPRLLELLDALSQPQLLLMFAVSGTPAEFLWPILRQSERLQEIMTIGNQEYQRRIKTR